MNPEIRWNQIECPCQPLGTIDCGYYVCRYMLETVQLRRLLISTIKALVQTILQRKLMNSRSCGLHMSEINMKHK
ncbi:hypothetical protein BVRB_3g069500 isoform B [Beta vulgaris subsp. vulgaris]|nr:hypothetical protein BVRB_3g069500 isoform B [Beta vulgaris subsp. vulgaris]